ncbi:hypothetical protein ACLOJK_030763 [Asimina triloba]
MYMNTMIGSLTRVVCSGAKEGESKEVHACELPCVWGASRSACFSLQLFAFLSEHYRKMLNFFIRKDVRKLLKRKDSNAGERGKALEELRASLYNELWTSECAKRQQQRLCGPTVALSFNFVVSVGIILMNKLVLGKVGFKFPIFLTFIHYIFSWFVMGILNVFSFLPASPPPKSTPFSCLFALGVVMSLSTGLANISLKYNSVGFYQMAKIAVTPTIVLSEFLFFGKRVSFQKVLALTVVSVGVAVATATDLQFHFVGACVALAWIIPSAINKILWSNLQQQHNWTALAATSATTHVVLGQFKTCVILLGGFLLFNSNPGILSICGAIIALAGMSVYTYLNLLNPQAAKPSSFPPSKSKLGKENGETENGDCGEACV